MILKHIALADQSTKTVRLGDWKRDVADARDLLLTSPHEPNERLSRPDAIDNSKWCSPIENQLEIGSCTAQMLAALVEYNNIRWGFPKPSRKQVSRLFEYYATRKIMGTVEEDSGAYIRDTIKAAAQHGCVWERSWKYDTSKFTVCPPQAVWDKASLHKVTSYHRINDGDIETMKQALAKGFLVGFGFEVHNNFLTQKMAIEGVLNYPDHGSEAQGGHAVVLVGYSDSRRQFKVRNSWGTDWGQKGYFWMDYTYVGDCQKSNDFWVVTSSDKL